MDYYFSNFMLVQFRSTQFYLSRKQEGQLQQRLQRNHELEITLGHSDAQKAGKPLQDFQSGTIGLSRTTCSCFRGRTSAKTTGPKPQNPTKLQPYLENSQQSSYLYREVEDYRYTLHILPVFKIGKIYIKA